MSPARKPPESTSDIRRAVKHEVNRATTHGVPPAYELENAPVIHPELLPSHVGPVTHGTMSRFVDPLAAEQLEMWLNDPEFPDHAKASYCRMSLVDLARTETRVRLIMSQANGEGLLDSLSEHVRTKEHEVTSDEVSRTKKGRVTRRLASDEQLRRWMVHAENLRKQLGLTPLSNAQLMKDKTSATLDLAKLWAKMDQDESGEA